jgi:hypothetical protein
VCLEVYVCVAVSDGKVPTPESKPDALPLPLQSCAAWRTSCMSMSNKWRKRGNGEGIHSDSCRTGQCHTSCLSMSPASREVTVPMTLPGLVEKGPLGCPKSNAANVVRTAPEGGLDLRMLLSLRRHRMKYSIPHSSRDKL